MRTCCQSRRWLVSAATLLGAAAVSRAAVDTPYDADGDGWADACVPLPAFNELAPAVGSVLVISGADGGDLFTASTGQPNDLFGYAAAPAGDLDGDGADELLVSAPAAGYGTDRVGLVYVLAGPGGAVSRVLSGPQGHRIGFALAAAADEDGDGAPELLVEALAAGPGGEPVVRTLVYSGGTGELLAVRDGGVEATVAFLDRGGRAYLRADFDGDGAVGVLDLALLVQRFGPAAASPRHDLNGDGTVDERDARALLDQLGRSSVDAVRLAFRAQGGADEAPADWCAMFPDDPLCSGQGASFDTGGTGCVINPDPCPATVEITNCPAHRPYPGETVTLVAEGFPAGGAYQWITDAHGLVAFAPGETFDGSTLTFEVGNLGPAVVNFEVHYYDPVNDCWACDSCEINLRGPCEDVSVVFREGRYSWSADGGEGWLRAAGSPPGGTYTWRLVDGAENLASYSVDGPLFSYTTVPDGGPGFTVEVDYTVHGCTVTDSHTHLLWYDRNGNGIPDHYEDACPCPSGSLDCDGDGYSNLSEVRLPPANYCNSTRFPDGGRDRDGDGLSDVFEASARPLPTAHWAEFDTDADGVQDMAELDLGLDWRLPDADGDGVPDRREEAYLAQDADRDGLYDEHERRRGWDPTNPDMDGDGIADGVEIRMGLDPEDALVPLSTSSNDTDGDGLGDEDELVYGTNPYFHDTDRDGLPDAMELRLGLSPTSSDTDGDGIPDTYEDADGDGLSNFDEIRYGTNPLILDTDGDGALDGDEVGQGGDPRNSSDGGVPPPDEETVPLLFTVGDHSPSNSEHWALHWGDEPVWGPDIEGPNARAPGYGEVIDPPEERELERGRSYAVWLNHLGSNRVPEVPEDYDYTAAIASPDDPETPFHLDDPSLLIQVFETGPAIDDPTIGRSATLYLPVIDIDVDSDNTDGLDPPAQDEDDLEEDSPGKVVFTGMFDTDGDGVPDFADGLGYGWGSAGAGDVRFAPVLCRVVAFTDPANVEVRFSYSASDPTGVVPSPHPRAPWVEHRPDLGGRLRLWRLDGSAQRSPASLSAGGDYIAPDTTYTLAELGADNDGRFTLFVEAVNPSPAAGAEALTMTIEITDGPLATKQYSDTVAMTAVEVETHDLRAWGPRMDNPSNPNFAMPALAATDFDRPAGAPVGGAITDGASICLVRLVPALGSAVTPTVQVFHSDYIYHELPEVFGGFTDGTGTLPPLPLVESVGQHIACSREMVDGKAFYVPPESYTDPVRANVPGGNALNSLETCRMGFDVLIGGHRVGTAPFILRRPPLVLVHGLRSSPATWHSRAWNEMAGAPIPTRMYFVDWSVTHTQGYAENYGHLGLTIRQALEEYRTASDAGHAPVRTFAGVRYAATRADVVGHSMGGQIARLYISDLSGSFDRGGTWGNVAIGPREENNTEGRWSYLRNDNWGAGDIRRLITLGSPFQGSLWADIVVDKVKPPRTAPGHVINRAIGEKTWLGSTMLYHQDGTYRPPTAIADLTTTSAINSMMRFAGYPTSHKAVAWAPFVGIATPPGNPLPAIIYNDMLGWIPVVGAGFDQIPPDESDLIVHEESQRNNLPNIPPEFTFTFHIHAGPVRDDFQPETASLFMAEKAGELLSGPRSGLLTGGLDR